MRRGTLIAAGISTLLTITALQGQRNDRFDRQHEYDRPGDVRRAVAAARDLERASSHFHQDLSHSSIRFRRLANRALHFSRDVARLSDSLQRNRGRNWIKDYERVNRGYFHLERLLRDTPRSRFDSRFGDDDHVFRSWDNVARAFHRLNRVLDRGRHGIFFDDDHFDDFGFGSDGFGSPARGLRVDRIRCRSDEFRYNSCFVGGQVIRVEVEDRKSRAACIPGRTFGRRGNSIWVDQGCDAEFRVTYRR